MGSPSATPNRPERQLRLNINVVPSGRHAAAWRLQTPADTVVDVGHFRQIARIAERGTLDAVFFADHPSLDDNAAERPWTALDPVVLLTAMAAVTERIGLVATASTTFDHPYHVARRYASLDHVSGGRAAWNVVTTQHNSSAPNFGLENLPDRVDRHKRADEFMSVVRKLWESWDDDAIVADPRSGRYADLSRVRPINHAGDLFSVRGPLNVPRTPQGNPVIITAGVSEQTRRFAARWADALFTVQRTFDEARIFYDQVKALTAAAGRDPAHLLVLPGLYPVVGSTEAEANARKREMDDLLDIEAERERLADRFGLDPDRLPLDRPLPDDILDHISPHITRGFVENLVREARLENLTVRQILGRNPHGGHRIVVGTPERIADEMEHWFRAGAADGYNLNMDAYTSGLELFVDHVVPELRRRRIFREDYTGTTLREHYGLPRPVVGRAPAPVLQSEPQF